MCVTKILTQSGNTVINHCQDCGMLNIWHNNLLLVFTPEQFENFNRFAMDLNVDERIFIFTDGSARLILCTPNKDINFVFTLPEWETFKAAMREAMFMQEVYRIIT